MINGNVDQGSTYIDSITSDRNSKFEGAVLHKQKNKYI